MHHILLSKGLEDVITGTVSLNDNILQNIPVSHYTVAITGLSLQFGLRLKITQYFSLNGTNIETLIISL